ncbi:hypothetical protein CYMTET_52141 [Cymbomonas tetramitiformis]|uniref:Uncharacterized protein n=1 Tax=Cymbomonas tetramitiformis TaxID=36881 RepID=A0AAE0BLF4_9CHLO|nr:hypothetical protein CYMTET_52141 [Cymbomonas tetramitiformis]
MGDLDGAIDEVKQAVSVAIWKALHGEYQKILDWTGRCGAHMNTLANAVGEVRTMERAIPNRTTRTCVHTSAGQALSVKMHAALAKLRTAVSGGWKLAQLAFEDPAELPEFENMEFEDLQRVLGARLRLWSDMATRGVQEVAAARDFHMQEWGAEAATLEQYQVYLKVKGLFSDCLVVDDDWTGADFGEAWAERI